MEITSIMSDGRSIDRINILGERTTIFADGSDHWNAVDSIEPHWEMGTNSLWMVCVKGGEVAMRVPAKDCFIIYGGGMK